MVSPEVRNKYTATIGIECHVQLKTQTKLFAAVGNDAREAPPNTLISHICLGMPGALPVLNKEAINLASKAAYALGSKPASFSKFDRKHYFYPDLPKGYQITQYEEPIIVGGKVEISVDGGQKTIGITRAHLEEDAGKSMHPAGKDYSLVDLNRAGTPLLEIVSEPDMHSPAEAKAFAKELYLLMRYADVSDADLYYGNMRFDVNVSVSKESNKLGTRSETKNLNSFRSVEKAVEYEINRQIELIEKGENIVQETRGWDDAKQKTFSQRSKEEAHDYRYFPEPDVPPVELDDAYLESVAKEIPVLPGEWRMRLRSLELEKSQIETLIDAEIETPNVQYLPLIEQHIAATAQAKAIANWLVNVEIPLRRSEEIINSSSDQKKRNAMYVAVYELVNEGKLSSTNAKALLASLITSGAEPQNFEKYAEEQGYIQESDENEIATIVKRVIAENSAAAEDVRKGEEKAIGFLVGQVMKLSQGKANPQLARKIIEQLLK